VLQSLLIHEAMTKEEEDRATYDRTRTPERSTRLHIKAAPLKQAFSSPLSAATRCHSLTRPSLLPYLIMTHFFNPQTALRLTYLIERLMYPLDGYPAPSPQEPTPDEVRDLRLRMNSRVGEMLPSESATCLGVLVS
jgi:hypothetical protein